VCKHGIGAKSADFNKNAFFSRSFCEKTHFLVHRTRAYARKLGSERLLRAKRPDACAVKTDFFAKKREF